MQNVEVYAAEHKQLWISNFSQTKFPIPPLKVQQEIVWILDKFTEFTARKKNSIAFIERSCWGY